MVKAADIVRGGNGELQPYVIYEDLAASRHLEGESLPDDQLVFEFTPDDELV